MSIAPAPPACHLLAKPTGAICNLGCKYCFFLSKEALYPGSRFRMPDDVLEQYLRQYLETQPGPEVTISWQGGEPTLMGVDFFRRSVELAEKYKKPHQTLQYAMQTNGTKLDDEWSEFFKAHNFLIGISIDGPRKLHNAYRVAKSGQGSFNQVMRGLQFLQKHKVDYNILATVHAANAGHPLEVYRFFRDELGAEFIQFIPIVERDNQTGFQEGHKVTARSVTAELYGNFLIQIFDEWVKRDVGRIFVQIFDVALGAWLGTIPSLCVFAPTCGNAPVLEHTGDLYACDHFVEPNYFLGNITDTPLIELVASDKQRKFGRDKQDLLPRYCRECAVRFACNGGCPKNRLLNTPDGEPGLNYLCAGYKAFFQHIDRPMRIMADLLRRQRPPAEIMQILAVEETQRQAAFARAKRNDLCPCGSGRKFKHCHGQTAR
ncbi:MAG: anaerobic sulfatase maturase [Anaerolineae bacterium]|nr:anaerobic sulfatase maturase [Anaerolineae bacterium]